MLIHIKMGLRFRGYLILRKKAHQNHILSLSSRITDGRKWQKWQFFFMRIRIVLNGPLHTQWLRWLKIKCFEIGSNVRGRDNSII
jgi:hypothetical protein